MFIKLFIFLIIIFILFVPFFRFCFFNLHLLFKQFCISMYDYIKFKRYNVCKEYGYIDVYCGLFGQGKTKQAVKRIYNIYKRYNGLIIYDDYNRQWITQEIKVYSNVKLSGIPYIEFKTMQQLVDCQETNFGVVNLFLIDEASVIFNSREYKSNFNTFALNTILTSRHHRIGIILTSQRFNHLDALLRQVCSNVIQCHYMPFLHIQSEITYNAWDLECSKNPNICKPLNHIFTYTSGFDYSLYDTFAMVEKVRKECNEKAFVTDSETLNDLNNSLYDNTMLNRRIEKKARRK